MVRLFAPISLTLVLLATSFAGASASPSAAMDATSATTVAQVAPADWTHPMDVTPLTDVSAATTSVGGKAASGAGAFQVISQTPWPGNKVRVFFFGVQG